MNSAEKSVNNQDVLASLAYNDALGEDISLMLAHWFARNGRADDLRSLALMEKLSGAQDPNGMDALCWASRGGDEACLLLAGECCGADQVDRWGGGALHHWGESNWAGAGAGSQILLAFGVDPSRRDSWGLLPMHWSKDPSVWAWSLAALWGRGDPNAWMSCKGVGYRDVADFLGNLEFIRWVERSALAQPRPTLSRPRAQASAVPDAPAGGWRVAWSDQMAARRADLDRMVEWQNCIAKRLGIQ